jgi:hypothetical protein
MHQDLMVNARYRLRFADRVQKHLFRDGTLTDSNAIARFNRRTGEVRDALKAYAARWADARYAPSYHTGLWEDEIARVVNDWIPGRTATVLQQLRADGLYPEIESPRFEDAIGNEQADGMVPVQFELHLADPHAIMDGTVYYTLDGSDPRSDVALQPTLATNFVGFGALRSYQVPSAPDDGFDTSPPLSAVPLAYYSFDTDAGDGALANGAQNGTLLNGAAIDGSAHSGAGALLLDGVDDYVSLGDPAALQISGQISIATWVKASAVPSSNLGNILAKGFWLNPNSEIFLRYAGQIDSWRVASWDGVVHGTEVAGASADIGQWVHLVGSYDGVAWNLYRNGILAASTTDPTGAVLVPNDWAMGARGTGTERFFHGLIDELYLFDTAISEDDIQKLYSESDPIWPLPDYAPATNWLTGAGGFGYDDPGGALLPFVGTDVRADMENVNASLLTRVGFSVTPGALNGMNYMELNVAYDAGFVAYLNGVEVCRMGAPQILTGISVATSVNTAATELVTIDLSAWTSLLVEGDNLLAVQSLNDSANSTNHLIHYQLRGGHIPDPISASAKVYTGSISVTSPVTINARIRRNGGWSAMTSAVFYSNADPASDLNTVISQIHYHPASDPGDMYPASAYEFLELMNISTQAVELSDVHLREDVHFDFPYGSFLAPGERVQLVGARTAFETRYTNQPTRVIGSFAGDLANEGGRLHLYSNTTGTIRDFSFDDELPWPEAADGSGYGLVLIQPMSNPAHGDAINWRRSTARHARPGVSDSMAFTGDPSADNDFDGLSALVEYALGTRDDVYSPNPWALSISDSGGPTFEAQIDRQVHADDIIWMPEWSDDLKHWSNDPGLFEHQSLPGVDPLMNTEIYRISNMESASREYMRIRIKNR